MSNLSKVPIISIIPDDFNNDNDNDDENLNIQSVATDTEDIYFTSEKRKKRSKKIVTKKDDATDIEDLEGSEDEHAFFIHENPISMDEVFDTDIPAVEESCKVEDKSSRSRPKLKTQASTTKSYLQLREVEATQALTDVEDIDASGEDDEESEAELSDTDLLKEIMHDAGTIAISDNVRKFLQSSASPMYTPIDGQSENEDEKRNIRKQSYPLHSSDSHLRPLIVSPQMSDLTDTEVLTYDTTEGHKKSKHSRNKRRSLPKNLKLNANPGVSSKSRGTLPFILNESESDDDQNIITTRKNNKKERAFLNIQSPTDEGVTDTEVIEGGAQSSADEYASGDVYGILEKKKSNKKGRYHSETRVVQKGPKIQELATDVEDCESDTNDTENTEKDIDTSKFKLNFVSKNKPKQKKKMVRQEKFGNLLCPLAEPQEALTDVENLNSDEDDDDNIDIPVTVVNDGEQTDTESFGDKSDIQSPDEIPDIHIPSCSRNMVYEKQNDDFSSQIIVTPLDDYEMDSNCVKYVCTDIEEMSGEEWDASSDFVETDSISFVQDEDQGVTEQRDVMKSPRTSRIQDEDTDIEEMGYRRQKATKRFLQVTNDDMNKLTDVEDLELSDVEVKSSGAHLHVGNSGVNTSKTDTEDFEASDNEQEKPIPELSSTPDILRQMGGDTYCFKDGDGKFTKLQRKQLNERSDSIQQTDFECPSPTFTDEIEASAEDDYYSRAETATPLQMKKDLDDASSHRVHSQTTKKIDIEADDEVMYLKGGSFLPDAITDTEEMGVSDEEYFSASDRSGEQKQRVNLSLDNNNLSVGWQRGQLKHGSQEWGTEKPSVAEKLAEKTAQDAARQDSKAVRKGENRDASHVKPLKSPMYCNLISSYNQLDQILDNMLAEVDKQERLSQKDIPQKLTPICVNSFKLLPASEAIIEIPIARPKVYETKHEIVLESNEDNLPDSSSLVDQSVDAEYLKPIINLNQHSEQTYLKCIPKPNQKHTTECLLSSEKVETIPKSEGSLKYGEINKEHVDLGSRIELQVENADLDSLLSFESDFQESFPKSKHRASSESLNDTDYKNLKMPSTKIYDEEHIYELVETSRDNLEQDIWWEGTYRDLSIVPEEDEDNISEVPDTSKYLTEYIPCLDHLSTWNTIPKAEKYDHSTSTSSDDTSDFETSQEKPIKAEIKLMVKTSENGKEDVEIRTMREFVEQAKKAEKPKIPEKPKKFLNSLMNTFPRRSKKTSPVSEETKKPTFTLQRLFIRCSESDSSLDELSKSYPEIVAASKIQYPLQYDCSKDVDLYANTPFYPCYGFDPNTNPDPQTNPDEFPSAYCDWFVPQDEPVRDSTNIVTNEDSVIKTKQQVASQDTSTFTQNEAQNENACPPQKLSSPELSDKASKDIDNKKEKSKSKGGFFSSLKSFVGRSFDSSDSESKEEKTPKKKKKDKAPKKGKRKDESPKQSPKFKLKITSPQPDKKVIPTALHIDNIPAIDEIESNGVQVTDLDAEPIHEDVKMRATNIVNNVINDGQDMATKLMDDKIQEFNFEGTITPEEFRKSAEPIIINEDEFLVVIEPSRHAQNEIDSTYEDIENPDDKKFEDKFSDKEDEPKSDTMKSRRSVGFLKMFSKKDSKDSDEEVHEEQPSGKRQEEHRKSSSFFGLFNKKSKDEPEDTTIEEELPLTEEELKRREESRKVQQQMMDTSHFIMREVELFEDVRPKQVRPVTDLQQKVETAQQESLKNIAAEKAELQTTQQRMVDTTHFLMREIELFEDVRPTIKKESAEEKTKPVVVQVPLKINQELSQITQQHMVDTSHFILKEVEVFEDVRPIIRVSATAEKSPDQKIIVESTTIKEPKQDTEKSKQEIEKSKSDSEKDPKSDSETHESKSGFFSKFQFGGKSLDKEDVKEKEKQKKQKKKDRKSGGFFSRIGEKFSGGSQEITDDLDQTVTEIKKDAKETVDKAKEKIDTTKDDARSKIIETKEGIVSAKDAKIDIVKDKVSEVEESAKTKADSATDALSSFEAKLQSGAQDVSTKDSTIEKIKETSSDVKDKARDSAEKTGGFFSSFGKKIKDTTAETTESVIAAKDSAVDKSKEKISNLKDTAKDITHKASTVLSSLEHKVEDTAQDSKENISFEAQKVKEKTVVIKESATRQTEKAGDTMVELDQKIGEKAHDTKASAVAASDSAVEKLLETSIEIKEKVKGTSEKTGGFFSSLGKKIKDTTTETKDSVVAVKDSAAETVNDKATEIKKATKVKSDQASEALTDLEQRIGATAHDGKESVINAKDSAAEKVSEVASDVNDALKYKSDESGTALTDMNTKIQENIHEGKESLIAAKDFTVQAVKDTSAEVTDKVKDSAEKTGGFFSGLGKKIKGGTSKTKDTVITAKDNAAEKLKDAKTDIKDKAVEVKDAAKDKSEKTGEALVDFGDKIKEKAFETKESTIAAKNSTVQSVKETAANITDKAKESAEKTGGFFSGLGKKIKDTTTDTKDSVVATTDSATEKAKIATSDMKDTVKAKTEKAGEVILDLGQKFDERIHETTESTTEKVKDAKYSVKDKTDKVGEALNNLGQDIKDSAHDTKEKLVLAKDSLVEKPKEVTSDVKNKVKDTAEKSGGFFSSLGRKLKGTAIETKDSVISASETVKEQASAAKESAKEKSEQASEAFTDLGTKIESTALDGKESVVAVKDSTVQKTKEVTSDVKNKVKDSADNAGGFFSGLGLKVKEITMDAKDKVVTVKDSTVDKAKEVTSDLKESIKDKSEQTNETLADVGKKIDDAAHDGKHKILIGKDSVVSSTSSAFDTVKDKSADVTESIKLQAAEVAEALHDLEQKIGDSAQENKVELVAAKDSGVETIKDTSADVNDKVKESADKAGGFFSGLGKKFKGTAAETKDTFLSVKDTVAEKAIDKNTEIKQSAEASTEKASEALCDFGRKIDDTAQETKASLGATVESTFEKTKDTAAEVKDKVNDSAEKTGGFFSGLGKKIKGAVTDTKDSVISTKDSTTEQVKESVESVKISAGTKTEKADEAFTDFGKKVGEITQETKETIASAKDAGAEKCKQVKFDLMETAKSKTDKAGETVHDLSKQVSDKVHDTKIAATDSAVEMISDAKAKVKETTEKTGGFFSSLGKKIKDTTTETKDSIVDAKDLVAETVKDKALDVKDAAKEKSEQAGEALTGFGTKIGTVAHDGAEVIVATKDSTVQQVKDSSIDVKDKVKDTSDKAGGFFSGLGKKIKGTATDVKEKSKETSTEIMDGVSDKSDKAGTAISGFGADLKQSAHEGQEKLVSASEAATAKIQDGVSTVKDEVQSSADTSSNLLSCIGHRIAETTSTSADYINDIASSIKESIKGKSENATEVVKEAGLKIGDFAHDTKDTSLEKDKILASDIKTKVQNSGEATTGFINALGQKLMDTSSEGAGKIKENTSEAKTKSVDTLSDLSQKVHQTANNGNESVALAKDATVEQIKESSSDIKISVEDTTTGFFSGLGAKIKDTSAVIKNNIVDTTATAKEHILEATDSSVDKLKYTSDFTTSVASAEDTVDVDVKDSTFQFAKSTADATIDKLKDTSSSVKETNAEQSVEVKVASKNAAEKTVGFFSGLGKIFTGAATEAKNSVVSAKDAVTETVKEKAADAKEVADKKAEQAGDALTGFGHKINETAHDGRDAIASVKDSTVTKVQDTSSDLKEKMKHAAEKAGDLFSGLGLQIKGTTVEAIDNVVIAKESTLDKIKETSTEVKMKVEEKKEEASALSDIGKKIETTTQDGKQKVTYATEATVGKTGQVATDVKEKLKDSSEKAGGFCSNLEQKMQNSAEETKPEFISAKDAAAEKMQDCAIKVQETIKQKQEKTVEAASDLGHKIDSSVHEIKEKVAATKDSAIEKTKATSADVSEKVAKSTEKATGFLGGLGQKLMGVTHEAKDSIIEAKVSTAEKAEITKDSILEKTETVKDSVADKVEEVKESTSKKLAKTSEDVAETISESTGKISGFLSGLGQKISGETQDIKEITISTTYSASTEAENLNDITTKNVDLAKDTILEKVDILVSDTRQSGENLDDSLNNFSSKISSVTTDTAGQLKQTAAQVQSAVKFPEKGKRKSKGKRAENSGLPEKVLSPDSQIPGQASFTTKMSDYVCYVTTPTMQRRGIGGSQRLSKDERPAPLDVSNMPIDISSDEEEYIVTEPGDLQNNLHIDGEDLSSSPLTIETLQGDLTPERQNSKDTEQSQGHLDVKRRPLFHIGSRDEESGEWGDKSEISESMCSPTDPDMPELILTVEHKPEIKADIDLIENKLQELDRALGDLEKANIELDETETVRSEVVFEATDAEDKVDRKLRRVERRFERMASETMEKDMKDAKEQQITSPEVEAKREQEFRTMVSQLSQDEVSECQKLYSTLWDEATFTPSEEWDSKTPDSQPDDIQDLPQGEVVYMAPVTLNKDHLINKAGIEVDVIPIKRSPCSSPLPKRRLANQGRAKSAMGFYPQQTEKTSEIEERGSLPDLTNKDPQIKKGSIMSAIRKFDPYIGSASNSNNSLLFNVSDDTHFARRQSTDSLSKGKVISAVKEWMARSTPFGSTDNVRSTDASSVAETISLYDDDNDSVDLYSQSEGSRSDSQVPDILISNEDNTELKIMYDNFQIQDMDAVVTTDNDVKYKIPQLQGVLFNLDPFGIGETSGGPLTNLTPEGAPHLTTNITTKYDEPPTIIPKPKPRNDKTDIQKPETDDIESEQISAEDGSDTYSDKKKFWENVSNTKENTSEISVKKRLSLFEEQLYKQPIQESAIVKKRASVHELISVPPVPKPRSLSHTQEESTEDVEEIVKEVLVSEYRASFKDPSTIPQQIVPPTPSVTTISPSKPESLDSDSITLVQTIDITGYVSDEPQQSTEKLPEKPEPIPPIKRRQMSVTQPPVAATRKTIFERSVSLPSEDLQDVTESSVKARKQFFEQQIKQEMVIDQLMTQLEEEELQEYKTLTDTDDKKLDTPIPSEQKSKSLNIDEIEKSGRGTEKKLSPMSSSSSQDTKTEDDITQYTPTSVRDLTKYFQPLSTNVSSTKKEHVEPKEEVQSTVKSLAIEIAQQLEKKHVVDEEDIEETKDITEDISEEFGSNYNTVKETTLKQSSTESEQSISSERSIELGSADEMHSQVAEVMLYKSDSISKPSDSLEVHFDKSEIEDSEKVTDNDQDVTDVEGKSFGADEILSDVSDSKILGVEESKLDKVQVISHIKQYEEHMPDTVWEVVQSQPITEIEEHVIDIPIDRQVIIEKDEELSGSVRDESDLGSEIHQDHSESYESERVRSERSESHSDMEQVILESLYHQKINPDEARKIASELIDDIEAEIHRRSMSQDTESEDSEPPAPNPEIAKNQISEYLRQLAESKGLDAKEVELVESVLARKQNELSKLVRNDTQTSSMEITDEDLKYSGGECDISLSDTHDILEEQIEHLEFEFDKPSIDEEKFSEKSTDVSAKDIHLQKDKEFYADDTLMSLKSETIGKVQSVVQEEKDSLKKVEQIVADNVATSKEMETKRELKSEKDEIEFKTEIDIKGENYVHSEKVSTNISDNESREQSEKSNTIKVITDTIESTKIEAEEETKTHVTLTGSQDVSIKTQEEIDGGTVATVKFEKTQVSGDLKDVTAQKIDELENKFVTDDGTQVTSVERKEQKHTSKVSSSQIVDHKREEKISVVTTIIEEFSPIITEVITSDESKSSPYDSAKSPTEVSSSSSNRKDDSDTTHTFDKHEVIFRKTKLYKDLDTSSSSGNLRTDRRSGADFEAYSSSGESHYQSFEGDSGKSRPCSSDVEGLMAAGSSEYESALTSQEVSSRSHITSTEYHTAVSSLSSRESMKSLDSESSGHMASVEVSEASETLVPSTFELDGDIIDGVASQLLEDEEVDAGQNGVIEPYDREIPEHVIRGEFPAKDKKSSFDTISDSDIHGESMDISEEDDKPVANEVAFKMKRSQEMTFQPEPKAILPDSPQSDTPIEMDERFGTSLEDGSVLSMSLSSQSDASAMRTVIETSRRDSDRMDGSVTPEALSFEDIGSRSRLDALSSSNLSLDKQLVTGVDTSTSTGPHAQDLTLSSVTITTSTIDENGTISVSTQVTSKTTTEEVQNGPTQVSYIPEYDDVVETKKVRGHRRTESTSTFVPSMIPGFPRESFKPAEAVELTLKEVYSDESELKDVDETEDIFETDEEQEMHRQKRLELEQDTDLLETDLSRPHSRTSKTESEQRESVSTDERPDAELLELMAQDSIDTFMEPIERPSSPEPGYEREDAEVPLTPKEKQEGFQEKQMKILSISEKSSIEEAEAEAAFSMVAHVSPAHRAKGDICPILEDEDAEKHELETRERAKKDMEDRRAQILRDASPGSIPDIMVTEHMTPLVDRAFHYPDLELEEKEAIAQKSAPQTPVSSKSSEETDQGREYILDDTHESILEEPEFESTPEQITETTDASQATVEEQTAYDSEAKEAASAAESPNSDSFEMLEKPDIIDDFVVIEEVAKEAAEHDEEGKSVHIQQTKYIRKHDEEVEEYLVRSAPTPLTRMTDLKYYPDGTTSDEVGPFDFEDSPPQAGKKTAGVKVVDGTGARSYAFEYDKELEASKKWIEMQFQGDQAALISAGYGYEMEFERGPLEDIKEEEATDFDSSRIGSLDSTKQSIGSLGSVKDSFSSTPEYDVLAGRKFFTRSGEHDDVSMSSLQEFESLEQAMSLENRRILQGSQDSSSNGSFSKRYHASRSGQGDDVSMSSLKEFEGLESACIEAHIIEVKAKEEEALLTQIDEAQESLISESESCISSTDNKKALADSEEEDYEKRMFEIDEIIKQAQSNVEKFIDMKDVVDKTESMGRGDSLEEVAKVPDLELDEPLVKSTVHTVTWGTEDAMQTSTDSLDLKPTHHASTDSLDQKTAGDVMTASTDSIEFQMQSKSGKDNIMTDSIEIHDADRSCMITSDSLELTAGAILAPLSDSIDEDGSRIGELVDRSSSSGRGEEFSLGHDQIVQQQELYDQRVEYLLGSTDSLDPSSSTATHATYQYETDSVMSGSFTSGGSNTMVSSTDTIDPYAQAHGVDLATAVRKVWFDEDAFTGTHFTTELLDDGSKPFVTEIIEPCSDDPEYSHTIHRKVELPAEIKKITFKGPDADLQLRQYIENFGEGEDVQETQEVDKDGNIHTKRVVQKRFIVKSDPSGQDQRISGPEIEQYLQHVSHVRDEYDLSYRDPSEFGLTKQTHSDQDGTKTIYGHTTTKYESEESALKQLLSTIASDTSSTEHSFPRLVDTEPEPSGTTASGPAPSTLKAQGSLRRPLRYDISVDDQTEVDPREHDWRFNLNKYDESTTETGPETTETAEAQQRNVSDQHQLSSEMMQLLAEMEKHSKQ